MKQEPGARSAELRLLMQAFIDERLTAKLKNLSSDDPKYQKLREQYQFENWINDAARRVGQLQVVTHTLKAVHPDAKGTNLYLPPGSLPNKPWIGSHLLAQDYTADVVGNAAALDVFKFLKLEHDGKTLLTRVLEHDPALLEALSDDPAQARSWMESFASITQPKENSRSSNRAKQIYWLVGDEPTRDEDFHLLSPLYPSSLAHRIYQRIQRDRFSEEAKAARKARREKVFSDVGCSDYPHLATQKLGGTKPQNISQLNSERGGVNYLLASLPPVWRSRDHRAPLNTDSVFPRFMGQERPRWLMDSVNRFLAANPPANVHTRNRVDGYINALTDELILFCADLYQLEPGWSADPDCRLVEAEQLWLDPGRAELDEDFAMRRVSGRWKGEVQSRFANQVNKALSGLPVGDDEHREWMRRIDGKLNTLEELFDV